jgi:cytochrome c biogenesis protein ResB
MLASVKLALILLIIIATVTGLSTFVIQGESEQFYLENYPLLGSFFIKIGFINFFRSIPFLILMGLFFINLSLCTVKRIYKEITGLIKIRIGPDTIHVGILLLLIGGSINIILEQQASVMLSIGDEITVGEYKLHLNSFEFLEYKNGTPRDWISNLTVEELNGGIIRDGINIEVNKPLRFRGFSVFQSRYNVINSVELESDSKEKFIVKSGYMFENRGSTYILDSVNPGLSSFFRVKDGEGNTHYYEFKIGSRLGDLKVVDSSRELSSGLLIKREPAYQINYIALVLMLTGFIITYIQKIGEKEK